MDQPRNTRPKQAISLAPLTLDQALGAALRVRPADLAAKEVAAKKAKAQRRKI